MKLLAVSLLLLLLLLVSSLGSGTDITVCPDPIPVGCMGMNEALNTTASDTVIRLLPGTHVVNAFSFKRDLNNVSFVGLGERLDAVTLVCDKNIGLAFFNVTDLLFEGLTINNCGLGGPNWTPVYQVFKDTFTTEFEISPALNVALFLGDCRDVTLRNVAITDTSGIGLLGINVVGASLLTNVSFERNRQETCVAETLIPQEGFEEWTGGGAYFLYTDYNTTSLEAVGERHKLSIVDSQFLNNSDCGVIGIAELYVEYSNAIQEIGYSVGAGGGLSIMMAQRDFSVELLVKSTMFYGNRAKFGSGVHVGLFSGVTNSHLQVLDCTFDQNGITGSDRTEPLSYGGGGLTIFVDLVSLAELDGGFSFPDIQERNISLLITDTIFTSNTALGGGGVFVYSNYAERIADSTIVLSIRNCSFCFNSALGGSALTVIEKKFDPLSEGLQAEVSDTLFANNSASTADANFRYTPGTVHTQFVNFSISGNTRFLNNRGTGLVGVRSAIQVLEGATVTFHMNEGELGGGMQLIDLTTIIVQSNSRVTFTNNTARVMGGAIYIDYLAGEFNFQRMDDCFLYFNTLNALFCSACGNISALNISLTFLGNSANQGSILYGSTLDTCSWAVSLKRQYSDSYNTNISLLQNLHRDFSSTFCFDTEPEGIRQVSTPANNLQVVQFSDEIPQVMPGQEFIISMTATDRFLQPVSEGITSSIARGERSGREEGRGGTTAISVLGQSGYWYLNAERRSNIPVTITGKGNQTVQISLISVNTGLSTESTAKLIPCLTGFVYDTGTQSCVCDNRLEKEGVDCIINTQELSVPDNDWVGPLSSDSSTLGTEEANDHLIVSRCVSDYCKTGKKTVKGGNFDSQCSEGYNRKGVLCGLCDEGYSVQFGSNRCRKCTNYYLFLVLFFGFAGIFLLFVMGVLHITVTEGYLNSIFFYCNIVSLFLVEFATGSADSGAFVIVSFLNLNLGIETCFYDGMDALTRSALQFAFVAYLLLLTGIFTLLARYTKLPGASQYSPTKLLATLMILCYTSVLQTCIGLLSVVTLETLDGDSKIRWSFDPSVRYFSQGTHHLLGLTSLIIILLYIIPLPILALFPSKLYSMRRVNKLKPFYDALWAPFKPRYRFWLGLRLMLRWIPFTFAIFIQSPHNLFALGLFLVVLLIVQTKIQPFRGFWRNLIDDCLVANIILLVIGTLYFDANSNKDQWKQDAFSIILAVLAYLVFIGVFVRHLYLRFPTIKKHMLALIERATELRKPNPPPKTETNDEDDTKTANQGQIPQINIWQSDPLEGEVAMNSPPISSTRVRVRQISFTDLREPLLEYGEVEMSTKTISVTVPYASSTTM